MNGPRWATLAAEAALPAPSIARTCTYQRPGVRKVVQVLEVVLIEEFGVYVAELLRNRL